jgi:multiple sugar transport system ATP-binding protein
MTMSGRIAVMIGGELVQVGTPSDVYDNPRDIRVAEFIGSPKINVLPGEVHGDGRIVMLGRLLAARAAASAGACRVAIRPERLSLGSGDLSGVVMHVENMGAEAFVHLGCDGLTDPVVIRLDDPLRLPAIGSTQRFGFAPEAIRLFDVAGKRIAIRTEAAVEVIREVAHV